MLRAYFIELLLAGGMLWLLSASAVWLYKYIRRESDADHQESRRVKREADDALDDLEMAIQRAKKRRRSGDAPKKAQNP